MNNVLMIDRLGDLIRQISADMLANGQTRCQFSIESSTASVQFEVRLLGAHTKRPELTNRGTHGNPD